MSRRLFILRNKPYKPVFARLPRNNWGVHPAYLISRHDIVARETGDCEGSLRRAGGSEDACQSRADMWSVHPMAQSRRSMMCLLKKEGKCNFQLYYLNEQFELVLSVTLLYFCAKGRSKLVNKTFVQQVKVLSLLESPKHKD